MIFWIPLTMKISFDTTKIFRKEFKSLFKKYKSLKKDITNLRAEIEANPNIGIPLGDGFRKIRMQITSKNQGKSGGARVITHEVLIQTEETALEIRSILFASIYDKSENDSIDIAILKKNLEKEITEKDKNVITIKD